LYPDQGPPARDPEGRISLVCVSFDTRLPCQWCPYVEQAVGVEYRVQLLGLLVVGSGQVGTYWGTQWGHILEWPAPALAEKVAIDTPEQGWRGQDSG